MKKRVQLFLSLVVLATMLLSACAPAPAGQAPAAPAPAAQVKAEAPVAQAGDKVNIILVAHAASAWDSFWKVVEQGNHDAARDFNVNLTILAPDKWCPECVVKLIDQALAAKPDGIGVTVSDGKLFEPAIKRVLDSGIPLLSYNSGDQRPAGENLNLVYIGQDEYLAGHEGGKRLIAAGAKKGVCVNQAVGSTNLDQRCKGFIDAMKEANLSAEVLGIGNDAAEAATTIGNYATAHPDVNTYLTLGPNGATPFYSFVKAEGLQGKVIHGTFDLGPEIVSHIKDGSTLFGIDQQPYIQGYMVVQWLAWIKRYGLSLPSKTILTGPGFVDSKNVVQVEALAGKYR
jgi:simple sugar transport system substrate-binding protein